MAAVPYKSFNEWEQDMNRIRACPEDGHLLNHVRTRICLSSQEIKEQVNEYLLNVSFAHNPLGIGQLLAKRNKKILFIKSVQDPWWYV